MSRNIYKDEIKKIENEPKTGIFKQIWNEKLGEWEFVPLDAYLNSFSNLIENNKSIFETKDTLSTEASTNIANEITKLQNELNIVDENDSDKEKIKKYYEYIKELKNKEKGENTNE